MSHPTRRWRIPQDAFPSTIHRQSTGGMYAHHRHDQLVGFHSHISHPRTLYLKRRVRDREEGMKRHILALAIMVTLLAGVVTPSLAGHAHAATGTHIGSVAAHTQAFDKTKFVLHLGAAYFAFHHFVYKPYKAGAFHSGGHFTRFFRYVKAGLALLFAYHEIKTAYDLAKTSRSALLHALISPLQKLGDAMNGAASKLTKGQYSDSTVTSLTDKSNAFQSLAKSIGYGFIDHTVSVPGA